ncbi:membrane protein [Staphylococcus virus vB_SurM-PSU5]|nr:membrane protein [Staphylococcus virus vB_SurM-PSU5]
MVSKFIGVYLFNLLIVALIYTLGFLFFYGVSSLVIMITHATIDPFVLATFLGMGFLVVRTAHKIMTKVINDAVAQAIKDKENK